MQDIDIEAVQGRIKEAREIASDDPHSDYRAAPLLGALATDAEALLASHLAMQRAGEEIPRAAKLTSIFNEEYNLEGTDDAAANTILDLFRPLFARLTQERDEARASAGRFDEERKRLYVWLAEAREDASVLRQRAERAEERARKVEVSHAEHAFQVIGERDAALARIAELESRPEPGADVFRLRTRAHVALLDWLAAATGSRDGHDSRIVGAMLGLRASVEPGVDVVADIADMVEDILQEGKTIDDTVRAVLSHLAAMGEEALASTADAVAFSHGKSAGLMVRNGLSPVLDALRAEVAELEAKLSAAKPLPDGTRFANMPEPRPDDDPEGVAASYSRLDK